MPDPKMTVVFYELDNSTMAVVGTDTETGHFSNRELNALRTKAKRADKATFGEVIIHVAEELGGEDHQVIAILPRGSQIKRKMMEQLVKDLLPADRRFAVVWVSGEENRRLWVARMLRNNLLD